MKKFFVLLLFCCVRNIIFSENAPNITSFEFIDQDITETIFAISLEHSVPIVCDDTVTGKANFRFAGNDFDKAFESFLDSARLYVNKTVDLWTVSKVRIMHSDTGLVQLDAYDVNPATLCEKLSVSGTIPVIHDPLPLIPVSIHIANVDVFESVKLIMEGFSEYSVTNMGTYVLVKKTGLRNYELQEENKNQLEVLVMENGFSVIGKNVRPDDLLREVFKKAGKEYISFSKKSDVLKYVCLGAKKFDTLINLICRQISASFVFNDNVYYILPEENQLAKIKKVNKKWEKLQLSYIESESGVQLLKNRFQDLEIISVKKQLLLFLADEIEKKEVINYANIFDVPENVHHHKLQYISINKFLENLPPSVKAEQIKDAGNGTDFFFTGSYASFVELEKKLQIIDKPVPRIKYDVLVIQFQDTKDSSWSNSFTVKPVAVTDMTGVTGQIGPALDLKFDVVSSFGMHFAAELKSAIAENTAKVFADTTLHGISGSSIKFQNTSTYRYRDSNVDAETGKTLYSGVTREIAAGLILEIKGWVSGDGMISSTVTATVSRQGVSSSDSANPPITSEKIITTEVRSRSGEPVILSGLKQTDSTLAERRFPILSRIPLIGLLFKSFEKTYENTEVVIYLVPHLENEIVDVPTETKRVEKLFEQYVREELVNYENQSI